MLLVLPFLPNFHLAITRLGFLFAPKHAKRFMERRDGDAAESYGDNSQAKSSLNWNPSFSMEEMCIHSWNWFQRDI